MSKPVIIYWEKGNGTVLVRETQDDKGVRQEVISTGTNGEWKARVYDFMFGSEWVELTPAAAAKIAAQLGGSL